MLKVLFVGLGGFAGAISRYSLSTFIGNGSGDSAFPYGTLIVNITGCLFIGLLGGVMENKAIFTPEVRSFLFIGLLGGFTTFSTFGYDTFNMARDGHMIASVSNLFFHITLGMTAILIGNYISRYV